MAFVKPYNYINNQVLEDTNQRSNEEAAKVYVNQEIVAADYGTNLDYTEIEAGEFLPVTNDHKFASSFIAGQNISNDNIDRAYFTSTTKANNQTSASSVVYRDLYGCGKKIKLDRSAQVLVTFQAAFIAGDNSNTTGGDGSGMWENRVVLRHTDYTTSNPTPVYIAGTRGYVFEGAGASLGLLNPNAGGTAANRRQVQHQYVLSLSRGEHDLQIAVNPKVEYGWTSARNFLVEVFYL